MATQRHHDSLVWGIILVALGGLFLLETFHVHVWHYIWRLWPVVFIIWGGNKLYYGLKERREQEPAPPAPPEDKGHEI
jgi:hypothetical protein